MTSASSSYRSMSGFEYDQTTSWSSAAEIGPAKTTQKARSTHAKDIWVVKAFCDVDNNGLLKRTKKNHTQVYILNSLLKPRRYRSEYQGVCTMSHSICLKGHGRLRHKNCLQKNKFLKSPPPTKTTKTPPISDSKKRSLLLLPLFFGARRRAYSFCD